MGMGGMANDSGFVGQSLTVQWTVLEASTKPCVRCLVHIGSNRMAEYKVLSIATLPLLSIREDLWRRMVQLHVEDRGREVDKERTESASWWLHPNDDLAGSRSSDPATTTVRKWQER